VVIGDTSNDIMGAKHFGVKSIGAVWNQQASSFVLKETGADFVAKTPAECLPWIVDNIS